MLIYAVQLFAVRKSRRTSVGMEVDHLRSTTANDDPKMLTAELAKGATHQNYIEFDDRAEGIKHAIDIAEPGTYCCFSIKRKRTISNHARAISRCHIEMI